MNFRIVRALVAKYVFFCSRNSFRLLDVFFWPVMDLLIWGFVTTYMLKVSHAIPTLITFMIAASIFWNVLYRAQQVVSVSFLDDVWSRNLLNIFVAPVRPVEYVAAAYIIGLAQALVIIFLLGSLASLFYSFSIFKMGTTCALLFVNLLLMGWSLGLTISGCILRWGPPAEALAWAVPFLIQPVSAVFYPVSVLPVWMQKIALCVPATHVFEGMRQVIETGHVDAWHIWCALGLNVVYGVLAALLYNYFFQQARHRGFLAKYAA
jgi:ABC-2 type transport system permease protein